MWRHVQRMMNATQRSLTMLRRWSCQDKPLPPISQVKSIHVYDFDNTLFSSPLPNRQLWNTSTCGQLQAQDFLHNGGWWHNPPILGAVGEGIEVEEARAWEGCWHETIVELVRLSMQDENVLNVLLTGRKEDAFSELIGRMVASKGLEFDMVALKPAVGPRGETFGSTMLFKQALLKDIVLTYTDAEDIRVYEDRIKHVKGFRDFFADLNKSLFPNTANSTEAPRQPINSEVIQVSEQESLMDPVVEVAEVQRMINTHNSAVLDNTAPRGSIPYKIKRSVFYTGYILPTPDIEKLKSLVTLPPNCPEHEIKHLANNILITPRPAPRSILDKVGGIGAKMSWRVTGLACFEQRVWAARVEPTIPGAKIYTENHTPCVVLATRRQSKPIEATRIQNWQPVPEHQAFAFESTVGEKVLLRIEEEVADEDGYEAAFPNAKNAKKHPREEEWPALGAQRAQPRTGGQPRPQQRSHHSGGWQGSKGNAAGGGGIGFASQRGGGTNSGGSRGGQRGGGQAGGFRGRGGRGAGGGMQRGRGRGGYRSLDDNVGQGYGGGSMQY